MSQLKKWREPMSALTHFIALLLVIPCVIFLIVKSVLVDSVWHVVAFSVFGISIVLLYSASTIYHMLCVNEHIQMVLKKFDHMMIFVLIAGTYTPICLIPLRGIWGWSLLISVWIVAILGIIIKFVWIDAPRWLSTAIYVFMGWMVIFAFYPLIKTVPLGGVLLLLFGGITYTIGAVIYGTKRPRLNFKMFGFHEIFHLFVMGGSLFHIIFMIKYIL